MSAYMNPEIIGQRLAQRAEFIDVMRAYGDRCGAEVKIEEFDCGRQLGVLLEWPNGEYRVIRFYGIGQASRALPA